MIGDFNVRELQISSKFKQKLMGKNGGLISIQLKDAPSLSKKSILLKI